MTLDAPFPHFGAKSMVADEVWSALGDVGHYLEPFCGSCAVLLARPGYDPQRHTETVCDADGHISNVWRAITAEPDAVAEVCDWPVQHDSLIARKKVLNENGPAMLVKLCEDPDYYDTKMAGYYIWAAGCWIGHGLICPNQRPHLTRTGSGVHRKSLRPPASEQIPHLTNTGVGVHRKSLRSDLSGDVWTPAIYDWFRQLAARLRYVRVVCGDWRRVCGGDWQDSPGRPVGIFFDPPYSVETGRDMRVYAHDSGTVAHDVRQWAQTRAASPDYRIVLAGYYEEHECLLAEGWRVHRWSAKGGYGNQSGSDADSPGQANRHREALFFSPHCRVQKGLFDE